MKYAKDVLKRFRLMNYKSTKTPIAIGTKLNKEDSGSNVDPSLILVPAREKIQPLRIETHSWYTNTRYGALS